MSRSDLLLPLVAAALLVAAAGVVASLEVALSRVSRVRVEELVREGSRGAPRLQQVLADPPRSLNLLLLLRMLLELSAVGIVIDWTGDRVDGALAVVLYVFVWVGPRTIGRQQSERVALLGAGLVLLLTRVLGPVPRLLILLGNALTPGKGFREGPFASEAELRDLVELAQERGVVERRERDMINSVFELGDTLVREVMVPRTDIVSIERGKTVRQTMNLLLRSGFSRVPVVGDNADDVLGVVYLKDLVRRERGDGGGLLKVEEVMRTPAFVPDSKPIDELLRAMQGELGHLAIVVDEYGGTAGLVTIEDVLEEIVGEIQDEYDREAPPVEVVDDDTRRVTARLPVDDLEELYGVELPKEDVETVGGLLAVTLGRVPIPGATVTVNGLVLVAESAKGRRNRIGTVLVRRADDPNRPEEDLASA